MAAVKNEGKTAFVKAVLEKDPGANPKVVNKAWQDTGHTGTISNTLVQKLRADMGLTRNRRGGARTAGGDGTAGRRQGAGNGRRRRTGAVKRAGSQANGAQKALAGERAARASSQNPSDLLDELERDIDRLIYKIIGLGGLPDVEVSLRLARRILARSHKA